MLVYQRVHIQWVMSSKSQLRKGHIVVTVLRVGTSYHWWIVHVWFHRYETIITIWPHWFSTRGKNNNLQYIYIYIPKISPRYPQYNISPRYVLLIFSHPWMPLATRSIRSIRSPEANPCPSQETCCRSHRSRFGPVHSPQWRIRTVTGTWVDYSGFSWILMSGKNDFPETLGNNGD